jgi:hypothetical protein
MIPSAPRSSTLFAKRASILGDRHYGSVRTHATKGAGMVPAYSIDSEIVCAAFANASTDGPFLSRRTPDIDTGGYADASNQYVLDGKEMTSLTITLGALNGAAWCPDNNKFYHGVSEMNQPTGDAACVVVDPITDIPELITGFAGSGIGGRCFYHPDNGEIWMIYNQGGSGIARINPATNTVIGYVSCPVPIDLCYCDSNSTVYFCTSAAIYKVSSGGTATLIFSAASVHATASIGSIEYVPSLGVLFVVNNPGISYFFAWVLNIADDSSAPYQGGFTGYIYYAPEFDKVINYATHVRSFEPDLSSSVAAGGIATDVMTAPKGCYCDNVTKIALAVQTGDPGSRYYTLKFFGAGDL